MIVVYAYAGTWIKDMGVKMKRKTSLHTDLEERKYSTRPRSRGRQIRTPDKSTKKKTTGRVKHSPHQ